MSDEVPQDIGELSRYVLEKAVDQVDQALKGASQELRDAVSVIRLVTSVPRRVPWYGASVPLPDRDDSVSAGTMMRNAFEAVGDAVDVPTRDGLVSTSDHWLTKMYLPAWRAGKRDYEDYLDHLTDPERWERETAERRLSREQADQRYADARAWLAARPAR